MPSGFVRAICQVGTFMICAQAIVHFRPKASYEKYLKMLVSAMILIQLLISVGGIFTSDGEKKLAERAQQFAKSMEESMQNVRENTLFTQESGLDIMGEDPRKSDGTKNHEAESFQKVTVPKIVVEVEPILPVYGEGEEKETFE